RQFGVKGGVEARHLRKPGKMRLCEADDSESRGRMQRREDGGSFEVAQDRIVNEAMLPQRRSAVHDAMPNGGRRRHLVVGTTCSDAGDRFPLAGNRYCLAQQRISARILGVEFAVYLADRLSL